jgi:hypothetical protein
VSPTPKCSNPCSFEVCVRPEDGYNVSRNMSPMQWVLVNIRRVVFDSIYLLNFEITQRYEQHKYIYIYIYIYKINLLKPAECVYQQV